MSDISVTAGDVHLISGRQLYVASGEAITAGQALARDPDDGLYYLADNDSATADRKGITAIALEAATTANRPIRVQVSGVIYIGGTISVGGIYCVSSTAGGICPYADLNAGDDVIIVGVGGSPNAPPHEQQYKMTLVMRDSAIAKP